MIRLSSLLVALFIPGAALAQPAPRIVFDTELPATGGPTPNHHALGLPVAIGADGVHYVLQHQYVPGSDTEAKAASVDLLAVAPNGTVMFRRALPPLQAKMAWDGLPMNSLSVTVAGPGDVAVFAASRERDGAPTPKASFATLLRLGADGKVKNTATLGAPRAVANADFQHATYNLRVMVPTSDNGLLLGGGFGTFFHAWWIAKVSLDGTRIWLADGGKGHTGQVSAIGPRPNGNWMTLVSDGGHHDSRTWDVLLRAANGKLLARHRAPTLPAFHAAVLRQGAVLVESYNHEEPSKRLELIFIDDAGKVRRRVQWAFPLTHGLIADGDGFAGIVGDSTDVESRRFVFRADAQGTVKWRTESNANIIVRSPDGHIVALVKSGNEEKRRRLVKFADP